MDDRARWIASVAQELGIDEGLVASVSGPLPDMVRDIAHGVNRWFAPLTAFLVGLAGGGGGDAAPSALVDRVTKQLSPVDALVQAWAPGEDS